MTGENKKDIRFGIRKIPQLLIILGWFMGFVTILFYLFRTFITIDATFHIFIICGFISFLINTILERDYRKKVIEQNLLYHYFGIAPLLCALILLLNFHFRAPSIIESHKVQNYDLELNSYTAGTDIVLEGNAYDRFDYVLDFDAFSASELSHAQSINLETAKGIFGYKVLLNRSIVVNPELY